MRTNDDKDFARMLFDLVFERVARRITRRAS
jgi:hypothetical protein